MGPKTVDLADRAVDLSLFNVDSSMYGVECNMYGFDNSMYGGVLPFGAKPTGTIMASEAILRKLFLVEQLRNGVV